VVRRVVHFRVDTRVRVLFLFGGRLFRFRIFAEGPKITHGRSYGIYKPGRLSFSSFGFVRSPNAIINDKRRHRSTRPAEITSAIFP